MLKQNLNITASSTINKDNKSIFEILNNTKQKEIYKMYYEQKILNPGNDIFEKVNYRLVELFLPYGVTIKQVFLYKMYIEYLFKTYKFLRVLYNLPVRKKRTHGISKKLKWVNALSLAYCMKTTPLFRKLKLPKHKIQILFFCEFINSLWFLNWWSDWFSAYKTRVKSVMKNQHVKWKYDVVGLQQGKAIFFTTKKKKTKHNRRKSVVLKNTYNIGFRYGFTTEYLKKILINLQKKNDVKTKTQGQFKNFKYFKIDVNYNFWSSLDKNFNATFFLTLRRPYFI